MSSFSKFGGWLPPLMMLLIGLAGGVAIAFHFAKQADERALKERLDGHPPRRPAFLRDQLACQPRTADQTRLDRAILDVARTASAAELSWGSPVFGYVVSYFAWHWSQADDGRLRSCPPADEIVSALGSIMDQANWPRANTELNDLRLVERLPPSQRRAAGVAEIAFLNWIPPSNLRGEDSRPYARQLLADQGEFALPWRDQALREICGDTRLGTSAAYMAVALAPVQALPLVERTMAELLRQSQARRTRAYQTGGQVAAIRSDDADRLIELGYALARGGSQAQPHSAPVIAMLDEVIARSMPPFGLGAAAPTEFCRIARHIGGRVAQAANAKHFCAGTFKGGDGAPRPY